MVTIEGLGFSEIPANVMVSVAGKFIKEFSVQKEQFYSAFKRDKEKLKEQCRVIFRLSVCYAFQEGTVDLAGFF